MLWNVSATEQSLVLVLFFFFLILPCTLSLPALRKNKKLLSNYRLSNIYLGASNLGDCTTYVMVSTLKHKDMFCVDLKFKSKLGSYDTKCSFHYQSHFWCTVLKSKSFLLFENLGWLKSWNQIWEGKYHICNEIKYCALKKPPLLTLICHILKQVI